MSTITHSRVWSRLWDPGSHFLTPKTGRASSLGSALSAGPIFSHSQQRVFSLSNPQEQKNGPRRTFTGSKSFASYGVFLTNAHSNETASATITKCTSASRKALFSAPTIPGRSIVSTCQQTWRREIHSTGRSRRGVVTKRNKSSASNGQNGHKANENPRESTTTPSPSSTKKSDATKDTPPAQSHNYLHLPHLPHMPHMPHRPTRDELLAAASGFWSRLKVRFKWFSIRSTRPWNIDDWSAFASWFVVGNIIWVFVGTTTFFSLVIFSINTVFAQGKPVFWTECTNQELTPFRNFSEMDRRLSHSFGGY